jgi:hypothetical protein
MRLGGWYGHGVRRLRAERQFRSQPDGNYITRPFGTFGSVRRVTLDQKDRLIALYLFAGDGIAVVVVGQIIRRFFSHAEFLNTAYIALGFGFAGAIAVLQIMLLSGSPTLPRAAWESMPYDRAKGATFLPAWFYLFVAVGLIPLVAISLGGIGFGLIVRSGIIIIASAVGFLVSGLLSFWAVRTFLRSRD